MIDALFRPFRPAPLGLSTGLSLLMTFLYRPGVVGALLFVLALLTILRYGFMIIEKRAWGDYREAVTDWFSFNQGFEQPLKLCTVIVFFALIHGVVVYYAGNHGGYVVLVLANLAAPAIVLIIALGEGFIGSLNPTRVAAVIIRTGFDYVAACFVLTIFSLVGNIVLDLLLEAANRPVQLFVYSFSSFYYILVVFFMMAWLVARHRDNLVR